MQQTRFCALACAAMLLFATGCGKRIPQHTQVRGAVMMDGQPYGNVLINFVPVEGVATTLLASAKVDDSGNFRMGTESIDNGVNPGKYKVIVIPGPDKSAKATPHPSQAFIEMAKQKAQPEGAKVNAGKDYAKLERAEGAQVKKMQRPLPAIYADAGRTPLEVVEVGTEPKEIKLNLKSDAK
jgi:hypothetical protein